MREAVTVAARPTMISAKYRLKEERRRMLKLSVNKLRRIEDPESSLRRSVLINNTVRRLQREQREARNPPLPSTDAMFADLDEPVVAAPAVAPTATLTTTTTTSTTAPEPATPNLVLEELEDVLSQFYMPPTPRMITSIDEDEARGGEDGDEDVAKRGSSPPRCPVPSKRPRLDRLDRGDADEDGLGRALADPTNTLEDFKDEVYLRTKPRVPLANTNSPLQCEDLRADHCGRRYTHTGHDRENIAPAMALTSLGLGIMGADDQGLAGAAGAGAAPSLQHSLQPYSCSQAHGQAQQAGGLVFHGLMATMES
ncbi:SERTA domain-containing protein 4 [Frankliniella fusca]|uniref:SERTA domain-containing protein 4 n=1 Tax=Frankliniella fusca TaxID=407009 RepID=A0AAE1GR47_9NEOP|nr:SERTA domain-containing protein 4 [Frankliniella fusca]